MPCYSYSSNDPIYIEPNNNLLSIEVQYTNPVPGNFSYATIARLCEIENKDQLCVYTLVGTTETLKFLNVDYTVNTGSTANDEYITYTGTLTGVNKLIIRRCTPNNKMLISFAEGAKLSAKQLNLVTHQLLFIAQEKQFKNANITTTVVYPLATSYGTPAAWNSGTTYGLNAYVVSNSIVYQSLQAGNTNNNPATQTAWWNPIEFLTKGFVIENATSVPVVFNTTGITTGQTLVWNTNKFIPGVPNVTATFADNSVTNAKLVDTVGQEAVNTNVIRNNAITTDKILNNAVTTPKIPNDAITTDKIANNAITAIKIPPNVITQDKLANTVYSEGTWTPTYRFITGAVNAFTTATFTVTNSGSGLGGRWVRIGNKVTAWYHLNLIAFVAGNTAAGDLLALTGVPWGNPNLTAIDSALWYLPVDIGLHTQPVGLTNAITSGLFIPSQGALGSITLFYYGNNANLRRQNFTASSFPAPGMQCMGKIEYLLNSSAAATPPAYT